MSSAYYLVCDKHRESCWAVVVSLLGARASPEDKNLLPSFLYAHRGCHTRLLWSDNVPDNYLHWEPDLLDISVLIQKGEDREERENERCRKCGRPSLFLDNHETDTSWDRQRCEKCK